MGAGVKSVNVVRVPLCQKTFVCAVDDQADLVAVFGKLSIGHNEIKKDRLFVIKSSLGLVIG